MSSTPIIALLLALGVLGVLATTGRGGSKSWRVAGALLVIAGIVLVLAKPVAGFLEHGL